MWVQLDRIDSISDHFELPAPEGVRIRDARSSLTDILRGALTTDLGYSRGAETGQIRSPSMFNTGPSTIALFRLTLAHLDCPKTVNRAALLTIPNRNRFSSRLDCVR